MKRIILSALFLFTVSGLIAQTEVQPPSPVESPGGTSAWVKIGVAIAAIAVMAIIFYVAKNLKKNKKS